MLKISIVKKHVDNTAWRTNAGLLVLFKSLTLIGQLCKFEKGRTKNSLVKLQLAKLTFSDTKLMVNSFKYYFTGPQ